MPEGNRGGLAATISQERAHPQEGLISQEQLELGLSLQSTVQWGAKIEEASATTSPSPSPVKGLAPLHSRGDLAELDTLHRSFPQLPAHFGESSSAWQKPSTHFCSKW